MSARSLAWAHEWDAMTAEQRKAVLRRDKSMRDPRSVGLVVRLSALEADQMNAVQVDAVEFLMRRPARRGGAGEG